ncbi:MAG: hypothetical protein M3299_11505 [Thermoproteota archaeon]|nr:hypothetical protein [Thermoproteota archaeon]
MELKIPQANISNLFKVLRGQEEKNNKLPPMPIVYNQGIVVAAHELLPVFSLFLSYGTTIARYSELSAVAFTDAILCISAAQFP